MPPALGELDVDAVGVGGERRDVDARSLQPSSMITGRRGVQLAQRAVAVEVAGRERLLDELDAQLDERRASARARSRASSPRCRRCAARAGSPRGSPRSRSRSSAPPTLTFSTLEAAARAARGRPCPRPCRCRSCTRSAASRAIARRAAATRGRPSALADPVVERAVERHLGAGVARRTRPSRSPIALERERVVADRSRRRARSTNATHRRRRSRRSSRPAAPSPTPTTPSCSSSTCDDVLGFVEPRAIVKVSASSALRGVICTRKIPHRADGC